MARRRSVGVTVAWIGVIGAVVVAIITAGSNLLQKGDVRGPIVVVSIQELNALVTDRWRKIDEFLGVVSALPNLDPSERQELTALRERLRAKHDLHAAALQQGNTVLAHERLRDLRLVLSQVDERISHLRSTYPAIYASLSIEHREFLRGDLVQRVSYSSAEEEGFLKKLVRRLFAD